MDFTHSLHLAPEVTPEVADLARKMAAHIRTVGHNQDGLYFEGERNLEVVHKDRPCCVRGAERVIMNSAPYGSAIAKHIEAVVDPSGWHAWPITSWNDRTPTDDVLAVLDKIGASA